MDVDGDDLDSLNTVQESEEREALATTVENQVIDIRTAAMCTSDILATDHEEQEKISEFSSITAGGDGGGSCVVMADSEHLVSANNGVINGDNIVSSQRRNGDLKHFDSVSFFRHFVFWNIRCCVING